MKCSSTDSCYQIYSIGDGSFLRQIFDAVASITGSGDFAVACGIAMLLGIFTVFFKSILQGAYRIDIGSIFTSFLLYLILFVPKGTVLIEDTYTGQDYVVDHVPLGVALPGHIISKLGFHMAELFDQGFLDPSSQLGITHRPFLEALSVIAKIQNEEYSQALWDNLKVASGGIEVKPSLENFLKDCIMLRYQYQGNASALSDSRVSILSLLSTFNSKIYGTALYDTNGKKEVTCADASQTVSRIMGQISPELINQSFGQSSIYTTNTSSLSYTDNNSNMSSSLNSAINFLSSAAVTGTEYVKAVILGQLFKNAEAGFYSSQKDALGALMISEATTQRNIQWAAEQSMFMTTVRPFVTFFEGFAYAVSPFAAVLICLGTFGISVAIRYFQTLIWIQLWMPILAIINLYVLSGARSEILKVVASGANFDSIYAINSTSKILENYMATAGMLAASTPLIALFLLTAGSFVFTGIATRMSGADHVDEKIMAPDTIRQQPLLTNENQSHIATSTGTVLSTRSSQLPSISFGIDDAKVAQSAYTQSSSEALSSAHAITENWVHGLSQTSSYDRSNSIQRAVSSSGNSTLTSLWNKSVQEAEKSGTDSAVIFMSAFEELTGQSGLSRSLSSDKTSISLGAEGSAGASLGKNFHKTLSNEVQIPEVPEINMPKMHEAGVSLGQGIHVRGSAQFGGQHGVVSGTEKSFGSSNSESFKHSLSDTSRESIAKEQVRSIASSFSSSDSKSLTSALSKGIALSNKDSESYGYKNDKGQSVEEKFLHTFSKAEQFEEAVSNRVASSWHQEIDLRSFAFDARNNNPAMLDEIRSLVLGRSGAQEITALAASYQNRYGISDASTARDMAVLSVAHKGTDEEKALTYALWSNVNKGIIAEKEKNSMPKQNQNQNQSSSSITKKNLFTVPNDQKKFLSEEFNNQKSLFDGSLSQISTNSNHSNLKPRGTIEREFSNEKNKSNEVFNKREDSFLGAYQERFSDLSKTLQRYNNKVHELNKNLGMMNIRTVRGSDEQEHLVMGSNDSNISEDTFKNNTILGQSVDLLHKAIGDSYSSQGLFTTSQNLSSEGKDMILSKLGDRKFIDALLSEKNLSQDGAFSLSSNFMKNYAEQYGFNLHDSDDKKQLLERASAFSLLQKNYSSGLGINLAISAITVSKIKQLDENRKMLVDNSVRQDELMMERSTNINNLNNMNR